MWIPRATLLLNTYIIIIIIFTSWTALLVDPANVLSRLQVIYFVSWLRVEQSKGLPPDLWSNWVRETSIASHIIMLRCAWTHDISAACAKTWWHHSCYDETSSIVSSLNNGYHGGKTYTRHNSMSDKVPWLKFLREDVYAPWVTMMWLVRL